MERNYYNEIKEEFISNEAYLKIKDYSKNRKDLETYYNVGKIIIDAQGGENKAKYGNKLIKEYSKKLTNELGNKYSVRYLFDIRKLYLFSKVHSLNALLTMSHYRILFPLKNDNEIKYYIDLSLNQRLSYRELKNKIKSKEYQRLDDNTKKKLIKKEKTTVTDFVKNPIIIKSNKNKIINEKLLQILILDNISEFLHELGPGFCFIDNEYKIQIGNT